MSANPAEAVTTAESSTLRSADGRGVDLLILGEDELENEAFYLGDDPIEPGV